MRNIILFYYSEQIESHLQDCRQAVITKTSALGNIPFGSLRLAIYDTVVPGLESFTKNTPIMKDALHQSMIFRFEDLLYIATSPSL